jgi:hypothetical protein
MHRLPRRFAACWLLGLGTLASAPQAAAQATLDDLLRPPPAEGEAEQQPPRRTEEPAKILQADRPTFSTGTHTVAPGILQIEAGYRHNRANEGDLRTDILPEVNVRLGWRRDLEINIAMDAWVDQRTDSDRESGSGNLAVGFKAGPWRPEPAATNRPGGAAAPEGAAEDGQEGERQAPADSAQTADIGRFGFLGRAVLPTGTLPAADSGTAITAGLLWERDLNAYAHLFGELRGEFSDALGSSEIAVTGAYGMQTMLSGPLSGFLEYYVTLPDEGTAVHTLDTGITYLLSRNTQVDLYFGAGLFGRGDDFAGFGIAQRF